MTFEELPILKRAELMAVAALKYGVLKRDEVSQMYDMGYLSDNDRLTDERYNLDEIQRYADERFPALLGIDYAIHYDPEFLPRRDLGGNYGDTEHISAEHDNLPYYNNYPKPDKYKGKSVVVFNNNLEDYKEAVALDALHSLRDLDPYYREILLPKLAKAWDGGDTSMFAYDEYLQDLEENGNDAESYQHHYNNQVDANIRKLLVDLDSPEAKSYGEDVDKAYEQLINNPDREAAWKEVYDYIMNNDGHILKEVTVTPLNNPDNTYSRGGIINKYSKGSFLEHYDQAWKGTKYDTPEWRAFWTKMALRESGYNPFIENLIGAKGYFQLMPFNRSASWENAILQFPETMRTMDLIEKALTEEDYRRAADLGFDRWQVLAGAWFGGPGGVRKVLNGANPRDLNKYSMVERMNDFADIALDAEQYSPVSPEPAFQPAFPWIEESLADLGRAKLIEKEYYDEPLATKDPKESLFDRDEYDSYTSPSIIQLFNALVPKQEKKEYAVVTPKKKTTILDDIQEGKSVLNLNKNKKKYAQGGRKVTYIPKNTERIYGKGYYDNLSDDDIAKKYAETAFWNENFDWNGLDYTYDYNLYKRDPEYRFQIKAQNASPRYKSYNIPYIPEKAITLSNGGPLTGLKFSTNILDELLKTSRNTEVSFQELLGLAARDSGLGNGVILYRDGGSTVDNNPTSYIIDHLLGAGIPSDRANMILEKIINSPTSPAMVVRGGIPASRLLSTYNRGFYQNPYQEVLESYRQRGERPDKARLLAIEEALDRIAEEERYQEPINILDASAAKYREMAMADPEYRAEVRDLGNFVWNSPEVLRWYATEILGVSPQEYDMQQYAYGGRVNKFDGYSNTFTNMMSRAGIEPIPTTYRVMYGDDEASKYGYLFEGGNRPQEGNALWAYDTEGKYPVSIAEAENLRRTGYILDGEYIKGTGSNLSTLDWLNGVLSKNRNSSTFPLIGEKSAAYPFGYMPYFEKPKTGFWEGMGNMFGHLTDAGMKVLSVPVQAVWEGIKASAFNNPTRGVSTSYATTGQSLPTFTGTTKDLAEEKLDTGASYAMSAVMPSHLAGTAWDLVKYPFVYDKQGIDSSITMPWNQEGVFGNSGLGRTLNNTLDIVLPAKLVKGKRKVTPHKSPVKETKTANFKSDLDWSAESWFKYRRGGQYTPEDVEALTSHLPEYYEIEKSTKLNGTWLKNPDGSIWKGDPREWVMLLSEAAKNLNRSPLYNGGDGVWADNNGIDVTPEVLSSMRLWSSTNPLVARSYTLADPRILKLYILDTPEYTFDAKGNHWRSTIMNNEKEVLSTNDIIRDFANDNNVVRINNVVDPGPSFNISNSKFYPSEIPKGMDYLDFVQKYMIGDDVIIGKNIPRVSVLGNNGNLTGTTIYKAFAPIVGASWLAGTLDTSPAGNTDIESQYAQGGKLNKYDGESMPTLLMNNPKWIGRRPITEEEKESIGQVYNRDNEGRVLIPNPTHVLYDLNTGKPLTNREYDLGNWIWPNNTGDWEGRLPTIEVYPKGDLTMPLMEKNLEDRALLNMYIRMGNHKPFNNYYWANDMSDRRKAITPFTNRGLSNCTLNATSAYGPLYTYAGAFNVLSSPMFRQVTGDDIIPGTMMIQSLPGVEDGENNKYHSTIFTGIADHEYTNEFGDHIMPGDSLYIYSKGTNKPDAIRIRPKQALLDNHGKTYFRYFRPD